MNHPARIRGRNYDSTPREGMSTQEQQTKNQPAGKPKRKIRWLRVFLATVMLIVLLVGGTITFLFTVESALLKPVIERIVTIATGRAFILEGDFEADLGRVITVRADGVKMANAIWSNEPYMLDIEQLYAVLDIRALMRNQILLRDVTASSARLLFEESPTGTLNWKLGEDRRDDKKDDDSGDEPLTSIPLLLERADLKDVHITLNLPVFEKPLHIQIDSAKQVNGEEDVLDFVIAGSINDHPVDVTGHIGPFTTLLVGLDVAYDINAKGEYFTLSSNGHFDSLIAPKRPRFELELRGEDVTKLTENFGIREITRGRLDLSASMNPAGENFNATIDGDFGEFLLDLSADLKALDTVEGLKLDVKASGPDISIVGAIIGIKDLPTDAFTLTGQVEESGGALTFKDVSLRSGKNVARLDGVLPEFPGLGGANLTASLKGPDYLQFRKILRLPDEPELRSAPFEFSAELKKADPGTGTVKASVTMGEISGKLSGAIADDPDFIGTRIDFSASGPDLQTVTQTFGVPTRLKTPFDAKGDIEITDKGWLLHQSKFEIDESSARVTGLIGHDALSGDTDLKLAYTGNLASVARLAELPELFPEADYELSFGLKATGQGIQLDDLKATINDDWNLSASGLLGRLPSIDGMDLKLSASGPQIKPLMPPLFQHYPVPQGAFRLSGKFSKVPTGFRLDQVAASVGNNKLQLSGTVAAQDSMAGTDLKISASGPNLVEFLPAEITEEVEIPSSAFSLSGEVEISATNLFLKRLAFTTAGGRINGDFNLALANIPSAGSFSLEANGTDLGEIFPSTPRFKPANVPFEVRTKGEWNTEHILFESWETSIDDATMDVHGQLDLPPDMQASNIVLSAKGASLARLGSLNGRPLPDKPFDLDATLEGDIDHVQIERLTAHVGDSDLTGQFRLEVKEKPAATVTLMSKKMDLAQFLPKPPEPGNERTEETTTQAANPDEPVEEKSGDDDARLIRDLPVPFQALNRLDLVLQLDINTLILPKVILSKLDLDAELRDGDLTIERLSASTQEGNFSSQLHLATDDNTANMSMSLMGHDVVLGFGELSEDNAEHYPHNSIAVKLTASGANSRELTASLNGYADMLTKPGRIPNSIALGLFGDFFEQLINALNPFSKQDPYTHVACGAFFVNFADGVVTIDPGAVLQTDKMNFFAKGSVDLTTEKLDVRFDTAARKGIGISAGDVINPFIRIGGTLAEPKLRLDPTSSAIQGGAAVATVGLSVVGKSLWGRWFATKDPCGKFIGEAQKAGRVINVVE